MQQLFGARDVRAALPWVVLRQWPELKLGARAGQGNDLLCQVGDGDLDRVPEIDRSIEVAVDVHQTGEAVDQVVDVAERSGLRSRAVDRDRFVLQSLDDEARDDASVLRMHVGPVGVEDARHPDGEAMLALVIVEERLGAALALVVAAARTRQVHVSAVLLGLRMDVGVAVNLAGGSLQDARA